MLGTSEILIIEEMPKNNCVYLLFIVPLAVCLFLHVFLVEQDKQYLAELDKLRSKIKEVQKKMKTKK